MLFCFKYLLCVWREGCKVDRKGAFFEYSIYGTKSSDFDPVLNLLLLNVSNYTKNLKILVVVSSITELSSVLFHNSQNSLTLLFPQIFKKSTFHE